MFQKQADIRLLPLKYTVISIVGVVSTLASLILLGVSNAGFLVLVDCVLNVFCLFLMTRLWKPAYVWLCTPLLRCSLHLPCNCADARMVVLVDYIVSSNKEEGRAFSAHRPEKSVQSTVAHSVMSAADETELAVNTEEV